jgi:hypothetical protein
MARSPTSLGLPAAVTAAALLAGCFPAKLSGYRPEGAGVLESGYCVALLRDRLRIRAPAGVELLVYTLPHGYRAAVVLGVELFVPAGTTVRWESPRLLLHSPDWGRPRVWMIDRIVAGAGTYDATAPLGGATGRRARRYELTYYAADAGTVSEPFIPHATTFTLELPALTVNGTAFRPGPVTFRPYRAWGVYTCLQ